MREKCYGFPSNGKEINMSTSKSVRKYIQSKKLGQPFVPAELLHLGSRKAIDLELSRLEKAGKIMRAARGVYVRPEIGKYVGAVPPGAREVAIAKTGGPVEVQGAEAANRFGFSTQVPLKPIFYTAGPSRKIRLGNLPIEIRHVSSRKLVMPGTNIGMAFSALWYLGKNEVTTNSFKVIKTRLSAQEYKQFKSKINMMPGWMAESFRQFEQKYA